MEVEIISKERIKPSSPTPHNLRHYKLSSLDQMIPDVYTPILFFYPNHDSNTQILVDQRIAALKKSLSEILTRFFPLAGAIKDEFSVDCDDRGACFTTAKVSSNYGSLSEFLLGESPGNILKLSTRLFFPLGEYYMEFDSNTSYLIYIQATLFEKCGGIVIGACISHKIVDGFGLSFFMKSWAEWNLSSQQVVLDHGISPNFISETPSPFPFIKDLRVMEASMVMWDTFIKEGQFVTKRFVFNGSAIAALKEKATNATRVEAISAFILKCAMASSSGAPTNKPCLFTHAVNLRKRAAPNYYVSPHESLIRNLSWSPCAKITAEKRNEQQKYPPNDKPNNKLHDHLGFSDLVNEVRKCISKIDSDYVKKLLGDDEGSSSTMLQHFEEIVEFCSEGNVDYFGFSSWCNFDLYEIDFGWGKPDWVSHRDSSGPFGGNFIVLMDTKCGTGIEAYITLDEPQMALLESNQQFRAFASFNPRPLAMN